jgi:hypothetical protein
VADPEGLIMPNFIRVIDQPRVAGSVVEVVLEAVDQLVASEPLTSENDVVEYHQPREHILHPHIDLFLQCLSNLMLKVPSQDGVASSDYRFGALELRLLSQLSNHSKDPQQACALVKLLVPFLARRTGQVPDGTKTFILQTIGKYDTLFPGIGQNSACSPLRMLSLSIRVSPWIL